MSTPLMGKKSQIGTHSHMESATTPISGKFNI